MNRRGNNNKFNENGNKNASFDKDHVIPKEEYAAKIPEIKEFYNFLPNKEKASIFLGVQWISTKLSLSSLQK